MKTRRKVILPLATALAAALWLHAPVHAQDGAVTEEMAQRIQQRLALVPAASGGTKPNFSVTIENDRYVVSGLADGADSRQDVVDAIEGIEGLDMDLVEDRVVVQ